MRVLLTHHFPLKQSETGWIVWHWAEALQAAGHDVRLLVVDAGYHFSEPFEVERVVCGVDPNADLTFALPRFSAAGGRDHQPTFAELSSAQLAQYRDVLRRRLDAQVLRFDPHVIHAQHVWVFGQLALETGVPYVLSAWGPELADSLADERYRALAEQAAENAGRILAADEQVRRSLQQAFESSADRTLLLPDELRLDSPAVSSEASRSAGTALHALYRDMLDERFGT